MTSHTITETQIRERKALLFRVSKSHSVMSDFYSPWNSPGQNTGVGSLSLLQGIFPTQGLNRGLLHCRQILYQLSHQGSPFSLGWLLPISHCGFVVVTDTLAAFLVGNASFPRSLKSNYDCYATIFTILNLCESSIISLGVLLRSGGEKYTLRSGIIPMKFTAWKEPQLPGVTLTVPAITCPTSLLASLYFTLTAVHRIRH